MCQQKSSYNQYSRRDIKFIQDSCGLTGQEAKDYIVIQKTRK